MNSTTPAGRLPAWLSRRLPAAARLFTAALLALATPGCLVRQDLYDQARAEIQREREAGERARADVELARAEAAQRSAQAAAIEAELSRLADDLRARDLRLSEVTTTEADLARRLDELAAMNEELSARLRSAGQSVGQLANERGSLSAELAEARAKVDELRRHQAAAEARAARMRDVASRLQATVDGGKVRVGIRGGLPLLEISSDALFDGAKTEVKPAGRKLLAEVAGALRTMADHRFQVVGHTDDRKARGAKRASSWDVSTARAVAVVEVLIEGGVSPQRLSAAGGGEFAPVAPNASEEGRAKNRRIEIVLQAEQEGAGKAPGEAGAAATP
ncbi:OmpA/MotB family protein [Sorangium cellulosum]|uniref:OmpA/MotB family protein n=1 Tax=Sorangium cellulosum TaxID=56 RepID=UPI00040BD0B2|nr:OmpA family protein [Sorangium cellulosum]